MVGKKKKKTEHTTLTHTHINPKQMRREIQTLKLKQKQKRTMRKEVLCTYLFYAPFLHQYQAIVYGPISTEYE